MELEKLVVNHHCTILIMKRARGKKADDQSRLAFDRASNQAMVDMQQQSIDPSPAAGLEHGLLRPKQLRQYIDQFFLKTER